MIGKYGMGVAAAALLSLGVVSAAHAEDYIALVSKGFQHQFWQAVKLGAEVSDLSEAMRCVLDGCWSSGLFFSNASASAIVLSSTFMHALRVR